MPRRAASRPRATPLRRLLPLAAAAVTGAAAAAAVAFVVLNPEEPTERVVTEVRTVAPPPPEFSAFDRELLGLIPVGFRSTCAHAEPTTSDFDSAVVCRPGTGIQRVRYAHARSGTLLNDYFRGRVDRAGISVSATERLSFGGDCRESDRAVQEWIGRGGVGHEETNPTELAIEQGVSTAVAQSLLDGRVLCHGTGPRSWVEWTDARLGVYAIAYGRDRDRLVDWWHTAAGPHG